MLFFFGYNPELHKRLQSRIGVSVAEYRREKAQAKRDKEARREKAQ